MSCWTAYLLRDRDGSLLVAGAKRGAWLVTTPAVLREVVAHVQARGVAPAGAHQLGRAYCQGLAVDLPARTLRCFPCYGARNPSLPALDAVLRAAAARDWEPGWDLGVAFGGVEEFAGLLPEAAGAIRPYEVLDADVPVPPPVEHRPEWFAGWDPAAAVLSVHADAGSADWYLEEYDLLTVVRESAARHHRVTAVDTHPVHAPLTWLRGGPAALAALLAAPPFPPPVEDAVRTGAVVDHDLRRLWYWQGDLTPARLLDAVRAAWPGWRVDPVRPGLADHLSLTGGRDLRWPAIRVTGGAGADAATQPRPSAG